MQHSVYRMDRITRLLCLAITMGCQSPKNITNQPPAPVQATTAAPHANAKPTPLEDGQPATEQVSTATTVAKKPPVTTARATKSTPKQPDVMPPPSPTSGAPTKLAEIPQSAVALVANKAPWKPGSPARPTVPRSADLTSRMQAALQGLGPDYVPRTHHHNADGGPAYTNRLVFENSPYLLQHAHNPRLAPLE